MPGWIARLTRLFRTDVNLDPDGGGNEPRASKPFFAAPETDSAETIWQKYQSYMETENERRRLYDLYDDMDVTDVIAGILDMYAEGATPVDPEREQTIWVESKNRAIAERANSMFLDLNFEEEITAMARELAKYGDLFERLVYQKGTGVLASHAVHPKYVHRKEDKVHKLLGFMQDGKKFRRKSANLSYPWDYVHFRLRGRKREGVYGTSILQNMIRPWRQLILAEDHSLIYQISRHPDRNLFLIDVGTMSESESQQTLRKFRQATRYNSSRDPQTGKFDHRFNPLTPMEDVYLGTRQNSNTRVEKLPGSANANDVNNLNLYIEKLFSAGRTPKNAFGFESRREYNSKVQLTNQDIRFARNVRRLQRALKHGARTLAEIHLILSMVDPERDSKYDWRREGNDFTVKMAPVSWLEELERLELEQLRFQIVDMMLNSSRGNPAFNSRNWIAFILKKYMHLSDSRLRKVMQSKKRTQDREDVQFGMPGMLGQQAAAQQAAIQAVAPPPPEGEGEAEAPPPPEGEAESFELKGESPNDWGLVDGEVSDEEAEMIAEMVRDNPKVRDLIVKGNALFAPERASYKPLPLDEEELGSDGLEDDFEFEDEEDDD